MRATREVSVPDGRGWTVWLPVPDRVWVAASLKGAMIPSISPASAAPTLRCRMFTIAESSAVAAWVEMNPIRAFAIPRMEGWAAVVESEAAGAATGATASVAARSIFIMP